MTHLRSLLIGLLVVACLPGAARAQDRSAPRWEIRKFDFRSDGVWRKQARQVATNRARLLGRRQFGALNAPLAGAGGAAGVLLSPVAPSAAAVAVSGVLRVPALLIKYRDTPAAQMRAAAEYDQVLFAATPPSGRPYTYRSFYEQLSTGLLSIKGQTYGAVTLDSNEVRYAGGTSTQCQKENPFGSSNCNGLFSDSAVLAMQNGLREALAKIDGSVDWTQYDSDGDNVVDLILFLPAAPGGECGPGPPRGTPANHLWAHRYALQPSYMTHSTGTAGVRIRVSDYILQSGVGGSTGCDSTQIMPIGTVAHETGHGFGLPDLYDTVDSTEGIGEWGLMGSGNYTSPLSPSRMDAWSLSQLGWVTVRPLGAAGTYHFGAAPVSDTAFYVRALGANSRGEYFLLENRQAVQSDSAMIGYHCRVSGLPSSCGGGLLIWHVDSTQIAIGGFSNTINAGPIHGLELVQADGKGNLDANFTSPQSNRGDAGDPYPGVPVPNVLFSASSTPAARRNSDSLPAGIVLDQIQQVVLNGEMSFRVRFPVTLVRATDTAAVIQVDGASYHVYRELLNQGTPHTVGVADTQYTVAGRTRQVFGSWSDGLARTHGFTAGATPDTLIVTLARAHQLMYSATSGGTVAASDTSGSFLAEATPVTLTANDTSSVRAFVSWAGDTVSKSLSLTLPMSRPYAVRAVFFAPIAASAVVSQILGGAGLTTQEQGDLDQLGNANGRFDLGDFLAWVDATGAPLTAAQRAAAQALRAKRGAR